MKPNATSGTSKATDIKLTHIARASLGERSRSSTNNRKTTAKLSK